MLLGRPYRILIPVSGAPTDAEAVRLACRLALREVSSQLHVVTVVEVKRSAPLGAAPSSDVERAEALLDESEKIGKELKVAIETAFLQAREAGPAIVEEISAVKADLVVMGVPYRDRFGEFHLGKTATYVLHNAPCRLWMLRDQVG